MTKLKLKLRYPDRPLFDPRKFVCDVCEHEKEAHDFDGFDTKDEGAHVCFHCMIDRQLRSQRRWFDGVSYADQKLIHRIGSIIHAIQKEAVYG